MKTKLFIALLVTICSFNLFAGQVEEKNIDVVVTTDDMGSAEVPYMGVFMNDLTFKKAYELHYNQNYGVYLSSVVKNSPASAANMRDGDIIMTFDGEKVYSESQLTSILHSKKVGDKVAVRIFRNNGEIDITLTLGSRGGNKKGKPNFKNKSKRKTVGYGGGSWIPTWFVPDFSELNNVAANLGFSSDIFPEKGIYLSGGGGKGPIGKRFFIGGMGAGYKNSKTKKHLWVLNENGIDSVSVSRKINYSVSFGGVTLDRRVPITNNFTTSLGCMLGGGSVKMDISQSYNSVTNIDLDNGLEDNFDDYYLRKSSLSLKDYFLVFQPKIMMMYHFTKWLAIRAEAGYMLSYSPKDWEVKRNGDHITADNLPTSNMNGLTLSVGPWFGF